MCGSVSWAQQAPAAVQPGILEKSFKPETFPESPKIPELYIQDEKEKKIEGAPEAKFVLKSVSFQGNTVVPAEELQQLIDSYIGQTIEVSKLHEITGLITSYYKKKGYMLSRAYIPPQTIKDSVIIAIREGKLGEITVNGNQRYSAELIRNTLKIIEERGAVNLNDVERGLLLLMDIPGLAVKATFKPGAEPGTSDIVIDVSEENMFKVGLDYNNYGNEYISEHRFGLSAAVRNLTTLGDELSLRLVTGNEGFDALLYTRLGFTMPIGYQGTKAGIYYQYLDYENAKAFGGNFKEGDFQGNSHTGGIWASHPFFRTRNFSWWVDFGIDIKNQEQEIFGQDAGKDELRPMYLGTTLQTECPLNATNTLRLKLSYNPESFLGGSGNDDLNIIRDRTDFGYYKFEAEASRYQRLPYGLGLLISVGGQATPDRLPSGEMIGMGGVGTVRGYDQSEFSADQAIYGTIEARIPIFGTQDVRWFPSGKTIWETLQLAAFVDMGTGKVNSAYPSEKDSMDFAGAGLGLRFTYLPYAQLKIDWAKDIGGDDPIDANGIWYVQGSISY